MDGGGVLGRSHGAWVTGRVYLHLGRGEQGTLSCVSFQETLVLGRANIRGGGIGSHTVDHSVSRRDQPPANTQARKQRKVGQLG